MWSNTRENGLFPRPDADIHLFYILGMLCSKAFSMGCVVNVPFNPAFFDVVKGVSEDESLFEQIDFEWWKSVNCKEGLIGSPFTYFGIESVKLTESEIMITEENYDEWLGKIKERFLCREHAEAFRRGFSQVIAWEATQIFTCKEIITVLSGDMNGVFTIPDLEKNVIIEHGYDVRSPHIRMLFEVLVDLDQGERQNFVQFVTGSRYLPVGGLSALRPKLTVARKEGINGLGLPSVMTCKNYLKLPPYKSRELLREKLVQAISEGLGSFHLT
jgi:E3 ubiquitin-protein ligase TRIP12